MKAELDAAAGAGGAGVGDLGGARLDGGDALMRGIGGLRGDPAGQGKAEYECDVLSQARPHLGWSCVQAQHERPHGMKAWSMSMDMTQALLAQGLSAALHHLMHGICMLTRHALASCRRPSWRATPTWRRSTMLCRTAVRAHRMPVLCLRKIMSCGRDVPPSNVVTCTTASSLRASKGSPRHRCRPDAA